ncbi:metallophosphoesterase family protein [Mucilaginibacter ginkgonis]|uniref:Metallophosphoesterase n=1 Tax=Mucilaginibacter ginkgonis TaxID=2682091 RepID=A0A6I4HVV6_9SPHI|nr:metallophosphoesterase [Mucilaginibacter ginkgonis]QQL49902.1 metallophosphoesterase [Mucilaginibacter ginkgonis]
MDKVIIHISDLHVTTYRGNDGVINTKIDSYLTTNNDQSNADYFIQCFIDKIKEDFAGYSFILIITGDISNSGEVKEFDFASKFINKVMSELVISVDNCIIVPGDHDVHRRSLINALDETPSDESYLMNEVKFKNFSSFYKNIKKTDFSFGTIIFDHIVVENTIVLIAINSNYKIDASGGEGYVPVEKFRMEIELLKKALGNDQLQIIACWHHNFTAGYDDTNRGQWEPDNRKHFLAELERQNIKLVLNGNEHTNNSKSVLLGTVRSSDSGAFSSVKYDTTFKVYPIKIDDSIILDNKIYGLQKTNGNDSSYFWNIRDNHGAKQPERFELFEKNDQVINEIVDLPHDLTPFMPDSDLGINEVEPIFYDNISISEKLYSIVREEKLFHSGHFHWSDTSRAHNWIDVSKLLEHNENLYFVQNAIIDIIDTFNLAVNCNLIIGLGYEGNIISSKASIKYNIPYSSLPYSYRYNDHHDYEKKLNYDNKTGDFKTVIIITDVVNDGRTIRKLVDKREKAFFEKVERIIVLSLFYTGHENINTDILNANKLPENYDRESDYVVNNIEYYTVKSLRVEKCPYGKDYKEACFIYRDELSCVHLFYDSVENKSKDISVV